jgi:hypothetical protein
VAHLLCLFGRHKRSAKQRTRDAGGLLRSQCARCGVRMVRPRGSRRWVAHGNRDLRVQMAPVRALLDRLTGPVIFLLLMGALLGMALWVGGPPAPRAAPASGKAAAP